jgi:nucleoside-diphosphate-sugar epimerase
MKIGLLGGSGLIGQDLVKEAASFGVEVEVFSRLSGTSGSFREYSSLRDTEDLDALVNLVGGHKAANFESTAVEQLRIDDLAMAWAGKMGRPYIYISSGAVFDSDAFPVHSASFLSKQEGFSSYSSLKIFIENRHDEVRRTGVPVSDLRLFSFSGEGFIRDGEYFLSQVLESCQTQSKFIAHGQEFLRDYVGSSEIWQAILGVCDSKLVPKFNLFSGEPINRRGVFEIFATAFPGWNPVIAENLTTHSGSYFSHADSKIPNYTPRSSKTAIQESLKNLLG